MALKITTHYKQALTSQMLNDKVKALAGSNGIINGFEINRQSNTINIAPGKCIISGVIIESDEMISIQIPIALQDGADIKVVAQYVHNAKAVNFYVYNISQEIKDTELVLAKLISQEVIAKKMRGLADLTTSLKAIKESVLADQELEYEGEHITSKESVDDATTELTIKGQTILNVAPIKDEVEVYADLQAAKNSSVKFDNTGDGIIDGINIKGKTYQNLLQGSWNKTGNTTNFYRISTLVKPNTTYTVINNSDDTFYIGVFKNNSAVNSIVGYNKRSPVFKFVTPALDDCDGIRIYIRKFDGSEFTEIDKKYFDVVLIEGDHTANPDLPTYFDGIKGVGDKSRNLFNGKMLGNGYFNTTTGNIVSNDNNLYYDYIPITGGINVVLSSRETVTGGVIAQYDKDKNFISANDNVLPNSVLLSKSTKYIRVSINFGTLANQELSDRSGIQLEEGFVATPYRDYYSNLKVNIKSCSKNLFDIKKLTGGIIESFNGVMCYKYYDDSSNFEYSEVFKNNTQYTIRVKIFREEHNQEKGVNIKFNYADGTSKNVVFIPNAEAIITSDKNKTIKTISGSYNHSRLAFLDLSTIYLEEGDTATAYEPYKESIVTHYLREPLMSLPNGVCDEIVGNKVIRRIGKVILNGDSSEVWGEADSTDSLYAFIVTSDTKLNTKKGSDNNTINVIVDKLPALKQIHGIRNGEGVSTRNADKDMVGLYIRLNSNRIQNNTIKLAREWFKANPTTVYYELETPIITPLDSDVVLPNGVHDEVVENKAIRKIGKVVLEGSEQWSVFTTVNNNDTIAFTVKGLLSSINADGNNGNFISDKFKFKDIYTNSVNNDGMLVHLDEIRISVLKSRLETQDVAGFKSWLQQNPTTVWYELREPYETPADNNIVLPNGVRDEIVDGKILRKVGKIVLDSDKYVFNIGSLSTNPDMTYFIIRTSPSSKIPNVTECNILSDKLETVAPNQYDYNKEMIYPWHTSDQIYFHILKSRLEEVNTRGFGKWLQKNPVILWYELAKPYYDTAKTPQLNSYKSQTNILGSTLIPTPLNIESYGYRKEALIKPSTKYTIHFNNKFSDESFKDIKVDLGGAIGNVTANNGWLMLTLTTPATLVHKELRISGYGIKVSNVMCNEGSEYREFVDGLAGVGDKSRNLFDVKIIKQTALNSDNGSTNYRVDRDTIDFLKIKPLTTYIISGCTVSGRAFYDKNMEYIGTVNGSNIFTTPYNAHYFRFSIINDSEYNVQVEEGNVATPYEEHYNGHKVDICSVNKNLFDGVLELGGMDGNGILDQTTQVYRTKNKIRIMPSTEYIYSSNKKIDAICYYDKNDKFILRVFRAGKHTTPANAKFIRIEVIHEGMPIDEIKLQVEQGNISTSYASNESDNLSLILQEPLRSLPNGVCDTIEKIDGQYVIVRRCGKVILDGSEGWFEGKEQSGWNRNGDNIPFYSYDKFENKKPNGQSICNRFLTHAWHIVLNGTEEGFSVGSSNYCMVRVHNKKLGAELVSGFKKWLSENPTTVIYELNTPTTHPLDVVKLPNGVADTVENGKRIRKVGKVILDGNTDKIDVISENLDNPDMLFSKIYVPGAKHCDDKDINCVSNIEVVSFNNRFSEQRNSFYMIGSSAITISQNKYKGFLKILKSELSTLDESGIRKWLSKNPVTIWYELEESITEEKYAAQNINLDTYKDTTHISSTTKVPAVINAKIPTNMGAVIKNDVARIEAIEDLIDKVMLPQLVQSHYEKTLLEFDYSVSKMLK